jgi:hypothetical protein
VAVFVTLKNVPHGTRSLKNKDVPHGSMEHVLPSKMLQSNLIAYHTGCLTCMNFVYLLLFRHTHLFVKGED